MRVSGFGTLALLLAFALVSHLAAGETSPAFNPDRHAWARFGVGSYVVAKHRVMIGPAPKSESTVTAELTARDESTCTVTIYEGKGEAKKKVGVMRYALVVPECAFVDAKPQDLDMNGGEGKAAGPAPRVVGNETVKAAGKEFACTIFEIDVDEDLVKQVAVSADGLRVRTVTGEKDGEKIAEPLTEILTRLDAKLTGGGKELICRVYEREDQELGEKTTTWQNDTVPGGVVLSETVSKDDSGTEVRTIFEVVMWKSIDD